MSLLRLQRRTWHHPRQSRSYSTCDAATLWCNDSIICLASIVRYLMAKTRHGDSSLLNKLNGIIDITLPLRRIREMFAARYGREALESKHKQPRVHLEIPAVQFPVLHFMLVNCRRCEYEGGCLPPLDADTWSFA